MVLQSRYGPQTNKSIERVTPMTQKRRKCKLVNTDYSHIDLRKFEKLIIDTVEKTIPGKNPKVFSDYFSTDPLTQGEAVALGRELSKLSELKGYGKEVTTFRLFDGRTYDSEDTNIPARSFHVKRGPKKKQLKGGRVQ